MRKRKGRICVAFLALGLCTAFFYRQILFCWGAECLLHQLFPVEGGWKFHAKKIESQGGKVLLSGVSFSCQGVQGAIAELAVGVRKSSFVAHGMELTLEKEGPPLFSLTSFLEGPRIVIQEGKLVLIDQKEKNSFLFSVALQEEQIPSGMLHIAFEKEARRNFFVHWTETSEGWKTRIDMEGAPLTDLLCLHNFFKERSSFEVLEGTVEGTLMLDLKKEGIAEVKSSLTFADLSARRAENGLEIGGKSLAVDLSYPYGAADEENSWWEKIGVQGELIGGRIALVEQFAVEDLTGQIHLSSLKEAEILLQGELDYKGERSSLLLTGRPNMIQEKSFDFDLKLLLEPESTHFTHLNLSLTKAEEESWSLQAKFKEVGVEEIAIVQHIVSLTFPEVKDLQVQSGEITSATLSAHCKKGIINKISVDTLQGEDLYIYWKSRDLSAFFSHIGASLELERMQDSFLHMPSWNLSLRGGRLTYAQTSQDPLFLTALEMELSLDKNVFAPSLMRAQYRGIEIDAKVKGPYATADWNIGLTTNGNSFLALFGKEEREEEVYLSTNLLLKAVDAHWYAEGELFLKDKERREHISYNFELAEEIKQIERTSFVSSIKSALSHVHYASSESPFLLLELLEKGLDLHWSLSGKGAFEGSWNEDVWSLVLRGSQLIFISPNCNIENRKECIGNIIYRAKEGELEGFFPLQDATIEDKNTNLIFHDTQGELRLFKDGARCGHIKTEVEGLVVEGELAIDTSSEKGTQWKIEVTNIIGSAKQLQTILTHFKGMEELSLPFDGRIEAAKDGLSFLLDFRGDTPKVDFSTHVYFLHGSYPLFPDVRINDLSFMLDWDSLAKTLLLTDITGRICSVEGNKEMPFYGKYITLHGDPTGDKELFFDLRLEEEWMNLVRLLGSYQSKTGEVLIYPEYSHFFGEKISKLSCSFQEGKGIEALECEMQLSLIGLPKMLGLLADFGGVDWGVGDMILAYLRSLPYDPEGLLAEGIDLHLSLREEEWKFLLEGKALCLEGAANPSFCKIDRFTMGAYNASCLLQKEEQKYTIEEFRLLSPYGEAHLCSGVLDLLEKKILFPLNASSFSFPEIHLSALEGEALLDFSTPALSIKTEMQLEGTYGGPEALKFRSVTPVIASYSLHEGATMEASTVLFSQEPFFSLECEMPRLVYQEEGESFCAKKIKASLTRRSMLHLKEIPFFSPFSWIDRLPIRTDGDTVFLLDIEKQKEKMTVSGSLEKGSYVWQGREAKLESLTFAYDQKHLDFYLHTFFLGQELGVYVHTLPYNDFSTTLKAFPIVRGEMQKEKEAILLECRGANREEFSIQKWEGSLFGCDYQFLPTASVKEKSPLAFLASIRLDMEKLASFVMPEVEKFIREIQLKKGFELRGELTLPKHDLSESSFEGFLQGKDFDLLGAVLKTCFAEVRFAKGKFALEKMQISDGAVNFSIPSLLAKKSEEKGWMLDIPEIVLEDLRPSLLRRRGESPHKMRPFRIKSLALQDIKGELANPATLTGKGQLSFMNTFKEGLILLDLPLEILSRLGLDMSLLVPIQGEMDINVQNGKLVFTRLKNSFSEGKRSHFYFHNRSEAYVDFYGNIHMDIRMKQFVLFKITQPFVLSIRGTLNQPKIALR